MQDENLPQGSPLSDEELDNYDLNIVPSLHSHNSDYSEPMLQYTYSGVSNASSTPQLSIHSSRIFEQVSCSFTFVEAQKIFTSIQNNIDQVVNTLMVEDDIGLWIMAISQWNKDKAYDQYYCQADIFMQKNQSLKMYPENNPKLIGVCRICIQECELIANITCQHSYCRNCWEKYIQEKLEENKVFFPCMDKCQNSPVLLHNFVQLYFPQLFEFYRKIICINFAALNKNISYCPNKNPPCDYFCERMQNCLSTWDINIQCLCGEFYCFLCKKQPHFPSTCQAVEEWQSLLNNQECSNSWIKNNTKKCPSCKQFVEKYIGCSKILCVCGAQFCYDCGSTWGEGHRQEKGQCLEKTNKTCTNTCEKGSEFFKIYEFSLSISRTQKKHTKIVSDVFELLKEEWMMTKFQGIRKQVSDAWFALKWGCISNYIYKKQDIDNFLQDEFIQSITKLMESVEKIQSITNLVFPKELQSIGDEVIHRRQVLRKNKDVWIQAWRN